MICLDSQR